MAITAEEFREGLSEAQAAWLDANLAVGKLTFTDESIVNRFSSGNDGELPFMVFQEFRNFVEGKPGERQTYRLDMLVDLFAENPAHDKARRLAFIRSNNGFVSAAEYGNAVIDRALTSKLIDKLGAIALRLGLEEPRKRQAASPTDVTDVVVGEEEPF